MARSLGSQLPEALREDLAGTDLPPRVGKVIPIVTVDEQGFPHPAMLSYAEVLALDTATLRLGTYGTSTTTKNLRRTGKMTLLVVDPGGLYYVKGVAAEITVSGDQATWMAGFECRVTQVLDDAEPRAPLVTGITYTSDETAEAFAARAGQVLAALRAAPRAR